MPRDGFGNFSLVPGTIVNTGDTILPSQHNPAMNDIAAGLTGSLARSGAGGMIGNLPMNGFRVTGIADGTDLSDAATVGQMSSAGRIGSIEIWPLAQIPADCILAYGQAISRTTYADLFAVYGTAFGPGDGSTTFNVPDYRGVTFVGKDDMGGTALGRLTAALSLASVIGSQSVTLTTDQIPAHTHGVTDPGHTHTLGNQLLPTGASLEGGNAYRLVNGTTGSATTGISVNAAGGGGAHPNVQPSFVVNIIIKALR